LLERRHGLDFDELKSILLAVAVDLDDLGW
jgi:hypothetical protein